MNDVSQPSAPDPRAGHSGGAEQHSAELPGHGQAQDSWGQPMPPPQPGWDGQQPHVAKPGVIPLRPLGVGGILKGAISTLRAYPMQTLGTAAVVAVIVQAIYVAVASVFFHNDDSSTAFGLIIRPVTLLANICVSGALAVVVGRAVVGQPVSFGEVWARLRANFLPLLGLNILYGLIVGVATVFLILPGLWLSVRYALASPALVLEGGSVGEALRRSRDLVRGSWWRVLGIMLLGGIITTIIVLIIVISFVLLVGAFNPQFVPSLGSLVLHAIGVAIASTIALPFLSAVQALLYVDQRMRREGMDIRLARAAGLPVPPDDSGGRS